MSEQGGELTGEQRALMDDPELIACLESADTRGRPSVQRRLTRSRRSLAPTSSSASSPCVDAGAPPQRQHGGAEVDRLRADIAALRHRLHGYEAYKRALRRELDHWLLFSQCIDAGDAQRILAMVVEPTYNEDLTRAAAERQAKSSCDAADGRCAAARDALLNNMRRTVGKLEAKLSLLGRRHATLVEHTEQRVREAESSRTSEQHMLQQMAHLMQPSA